MSLNRAFQTFPQLETRNLLLRRIHQADASALFKVLADNEVAEFYDDDTFTDISLVIRSKLGRMVSKIIVVSAGE